MCDDRTEKTDCGCGLAGCPQLHGITLHPTPTGSVTAEEFHDCDEWFIAAAEAGWRTQTKVREAYKLGYRRALAAGEEKHRYCDDDYRAVKERLDEALTELRCPACGCADPIDAESKECGCDAPVCARTSGKSFAADYIDLKQQRDRLREAVRLIRDRSAERTSQDRLAREVYGCAHAALAEGE